MTRVDRHVPPRGSQDLLLGLNLTVTLGLNHLALSEHCWFYFLGDNVAVGLELDGVQSANAGSPFSICYRSSCPETLPALSILPRPPSPPPSCRQIGPQTGRGALPLVSPAAGSGSTSSFLCPLLLSWTCSLHLGCLAVPHRPSHQAPDSVGLWAQYPRVLVRVPISAWVSHSADPTTSAG